MDFPSWFGCINNITLGIYTHVPAWFSYSLFGNNVFYSTLFNVLFYLFDKNAFFNVFSFLGSMVLLSTVYSIIMNVSFFQSAFQLNLLYIPSSFSFHHHIKFIVNKRKHISLLISIKPAHLKSDSTGALLGLSWHQGFRIRDFIWPWMIFNNSFQE